MIDPPPNRLTPVFAYIDAHRQSFLDQLLAYLRMPSISAHGVGIDTVAAFLVERLGALGMQARAIPTAGWPMVYGRRDDAPGKPTVLLYSHYDVQPPDPLDAWVTPAFEPAIRDGQIYARGAGDNKGQHFAQLLAIEVLLACQSALPCNVVVLLEGEEEIGSPHIAAFVREHRDLLGVDLVVTADGFHGGYGGPGSKTVLPHEALVKCDIRLVPDQTVEEILGKVATHVHHHAPEVEFVPQHGMDPSKKPIDSPFAPLVRRALAAGQGEEPLIIPAMGGSLPEYVWTKILGVHAFVTPYANHDEANHAPNENIEVERFFKGIKTGAALLTYLGGGE